MSTHLTSTDLDDWSRRRDSEAHLPTLVRKLVMATVRPDWIRVPAAEGVALPGLDGVVNVAGGAPPYVPVGASAWEFGTSAGQRKKAVDDYEKRTRETTAEERATTTFVAVTSRRWGAGAKWVADMKERGDGWKDIISLAADELALWLETCPGVEAWLGEHLGIRSLGDIGIGDWFTRWSRQTNPAMPPGVLVAGRGTDVLRVLDALDGSPTVVPVRAPSIEDAVAFVAATLLVRSKPNPASGDQADGAPGHVQVDAPGVDAQSRRPEKLEALRERTIVVTDSDGWRRWSVHATSLILVPLFVPDSIDGAVDAGHHVVLPLLARSGHEGRLPPLDPHAAAAAWEATGVEFYKSQEYALACRRNLGSIRRRLSRYGRQEPPWAQGASSALLASALLAGGWQADRAGDQAVLVELTGRASWRALARDLAELAAVEDPPLGFVGDEWDFTDIVDAWDALGRLVTTEDLRAYFDRVPDVLTEADPGRGQSDVERIASTLRGDPPRRRYSIRLRKGMATTLAVLGGVVGDALAAGDRSGQAVTTIAVRDLFRNADGERWLALADVLELLAEAAPDAFLDALDESLRVSPPPVMELFDEADDAFGGSRSAHSSLLWALETLAFSAAHVSRVCVVLARLAVLDPGGRLGNRPSASLTAILDLLAPQGAVNAANRLAVLDAVTRAVPELEVTLMASLAGRESVGIIRSGPQYRDWPTLRTVSTRAEYGTAMNEICTRLLTTSSSYAPQVAGLLERFSSADQGRILTMFDARWDELGGDGRDGVLEVLLTLADRHRRYREAQWAMPDEDLRALDEFLSTHGLVVAGRADVALFGWTADVDEHRRSSDSVRPSLEERRRDVVAALLVSGLDAVVSFAQEVELPGLVGRSLADVTDDHDDAVLDLLGSDRPPDDPIHLFAVNMARRRAEDLGWLATQVAARPGQAGRLLLCADISEALLDLVETADQEQQAVFWSSVSPYRIPSGSLERVADGLLLVDRPFTALVAVSANTQSAPSADLIVRVLSAPTQGTKESPRGAGFSLDYEVGRLLDQLESIGVPDDQIAELEFFYLPALTHVREPRALHRELGRHPELFADVVSRVYRPDEALDPESTGATSADGEPLDEGGGEGNEPDDDSPLSDEDFRFSDACWRLLHEWHGPLPGGLPDTPPNAEDLQAWVDQARVDLAARSVTRVASMVIGEALAAAVTDADGTWPCLPVRSVLEHEQDASLEEALIGSRINQRGVTARGVYDGGLQERELAAMYRRWGEAVRDGWPRTGAVLEELARGYDEDGRQQDRRAERDARR
ncbi:hypothetical protein [Cellulomonas sp.]|uniref:hypothetical protein n=1 Tax=Cellulomonas sp. TaxID=40001 RepID=UPI003BAA101E